MDLRSPVHEMVNAARVTSEVGRIERALDRMKSELDAAAALVR